MGVKRELSSIDKASLTRIERHAREVLAQCGHLRRNGSGDEMRFSLIFRCAYDTVTEARRAFRRFEESKGKRWSYR